MSDKNKNRKSRLTEFFRYHRNELTGEERNSFERELQKDPFTEEASEGFQSIFRESASEDISDLEKRLKVRTSGRKTFMLYRIAASLAILVAITSIFLIIEKNRSSKQIAVNTLEPPALEISRSKPITEPENKPISPEKQVTNEKRKTDKKESATSSGLAGAGKERPAENAVQDKSTSNISSQSAQAEKNEVSADRVSEAVVSEIVEDRISPPAGAVARDRSIKKAVSPKEEKISGYMPPQPVNGKSEFDKYIRENIHRPDSLTTEQTEEVSISFIVRTNGNIEKIKIVSSPGKIYSDEAIRLIKSGPAWKPAEQSGKRIEERIIVKILFR